MVKFALPLVVLAMIASVAAAPAPAPAGASNITNFSFEQWVDDIIANPDTALTVDEAMAVAQAQAADVAGSTGGLQRRGALCDQESVGWTRAPVCPPPPPGALQHP
jgi:hypothetical protein